MSRPTHKKKKVALSWSSGKDSAWALHLLRQSPEIEVAGLITTFNSNHDRVAMHAVRRDLVEAQAYRVDLPLWPVELPWPCSNAIYEERIAAAWQRAIQNGITAIAFGDLFLADIRQYREAQLQHLGLEALFPLWHLPTTALARDMIHAGVNAIITCVDPTKLNRTFAGRAFDPGLLADLPNSVDPCGENGEFHTFVSDAPGFSSSIPIELAYIVERDNFVFADVSLLQPGHA